MMQDSKHSECFHELRHAVAIFPVVRNLFFHRTAVILCWDAPGHFRCKCLVRGIENFQQDSAMLRRIVSALFIVGCVLIDWPVMAAESALDAISTDASGVIRLKKPKATL